MSNGLSLTDDIAATLQARLSWPQADGCAADVVAMFGRRMQATRLHCQLCAAPVTHLVTGRLNGSEAAVMTCEPCSHRQADEMARWSGRSAVQRFMLIPENGD
jgi:hypothetical protein